MKLFKKKTCEELEREKWDQALTYDSPGMNVWARMITLQGFMLFVALPSIAILGLAASEKPQLGLFWLIVLSGAFLIGFVMKKVEDRFGKNTSVLKRWLIMMGTCIAGSAEFILLAAFLVPLIMHQ